MKLGGLQTREADSCREHPLETDVFFCVACQKIMCKKFRHADEHGVLCGHAVTSLPYGVSVLKAKMQAAEKALLDVVDAAKHFQIYDSANRDDTSRETAAIIDEINQSISGVINELEAVRTNLTADALRVAQFNSSVHGDDPLAAAQHIRRSGLKTVKHLRDLNENCGVSQLNSAVNFATNIQQELEKIEQRQLRERLQAVPQKIDVRWTEEMHATQDYISSFRQYSDSLHERRHGTEENQVIDI